MPQAAEGGLGWETNHKGSGDGSPQRGPGAESPEAEEFLKYIVTSKFYANFGILVFHTF